MLWNDSFFRVLRYLQEHTFGDLRDVFHIYIFFRVFRNVF